MADLGVQVLQVASGLGNGAAGAEHVGRALQQLAPPLGHLVGVNVVLLRDLGDRLVALDGVQGHLGLERRRVVATGSSAHLSAPDLGLYPRPAEQLIHFAACSEIRNRLSARIGSNYPRKGVVD